MSLRIVFMGTADFAVPTLVEIVGRGHEVVAVYTRAPKPGASRARCHAESDRTRGAPFRPATAHAGDVAHGGGDKYRARPWCGRSDRRRLWPAPAQGDSRSV